MQPAQFPKFYKIRGLKMENKKLTMREMICYGIRRHHRQRVSSVHRPVCHRVLHRCAGISATLAGLIFMGSRVFDGINDIAVGYISDRYGHYKRWILYGSIATAVAFVIMFTNFHPSTKMQSVYALAAFCFWTLMYTCYAIPFNAFASTMTQNTEERTLPQFYPLCHCGGSVP